mgnify:CR=1 FL=1
MENKIICWWSGGITSSVACKLAIDIYGIDNCRVIMIDTQNEHTDTYRFKNDCEKWYGQEIETIQNKKYEDHLDVVLSTRYVNGAGGARCTKELKKNVRFDFEKGNKIAAQVWGYEFEASEINRAIRTQEQYAYTNPLFPLIENKLSKNYCTSEFLAACRLPWNQVHLLFQASSLVP